MLLDADLRREGRSGPLVRTLGSYRAYYDRWSLTWESQALLRARAVAGDVELGEAFTALVDPLRWPAGGLTDEEVVEIRRVKARVESERALRESQEMLRLVLDNIPQLVSWKDKALRYLGANRATPFPDFVTVAKGFGVGAAEVSTKSDLDAALIEMIDSPGAFVLNVNVPHQEHVLPMIPSGMTVRDMIKA